MKQRRSIIGRWWLPLALLGVAAALLADPGTDYKIDPGLMSRLADDAEATAPFFVVFGERPNLAPAHRMTDRAARARFVIQALQATANRSQAGVRGYLRGRGVDFTAFWIENKVYVRGGTLELARELARRPEVVAILPEAVYTLPTPQGGTVQSAGWNISQIRADQVWPTTKGAGLVVANIDTGVQYTHPALVNQYRGKTAGGFMHSGNWYDPSRGCATAPCDNNGHGTHTMGTMVGDDGGTNQIGVAPQARWIACRGCAVGSSCLDSHLTACAQWILNPDGNVNTADHPDVVNNSWGGGSNPWYRSYVQNWRAAGVFPAFSIGNSGPGCGTAGSPGDYPESFASGATDILDAIADFSSRGPSAFGGIKPNLTAPGVSVRSSYPTNTYAYGSGTSMASPHTAGTVALVWAAAPGYRANISGTEAILRSSALPLTTTQECGGVPGSTVPNNTYGWGRLDALKAVQDASGPVNQPPTVTITAPPNGSAYTCPATVNFTGTASDPEEGDLTGSIVWTDNGVSIPSGGGAVSKYYDCAQAGSHSIVARVTDSKGASDTDSITISIVNGSIPAAPSGLKAAVSGSTVTLTWMDNSDNEQGFKIERKPKVGTWSQIGLVGANVRSYSDSPGKGNWQYRVRAYNASGDSAYSNIASVRVK